MNTRRSSRKKPNNCFEELSEAIDESKTIDIVEGSSVITEDTTTKVIDNVSELRNALQALENKTTAQYCNLEFSFRQVTDSITALHDSIADLHSHQTSLITLTRIMLTSILVPIMMMMTKMTWMKITILT